MIRERVYDDFVQVDGFRFGYWIAADDDMGPPWEEHDGHGPVSGWVSRGKRPGELELDSSRRLKQFYDFAEAVKIARRDGWGGKGDSKGQQAASAARADYEHLRRWCAQQWHWCGVCVELVNADGEPMGEPMQALWGIESDAREYHEAVAIELGREIIHQLQAAA